MSGAELSIVEDPRFRDLEFVVGYASSESLRRHVPWRGQKLRSTSHQERKRGSGDRGATKVARRKADAPERGSRLWELYQTAGVLRMIQAEPLGIDARPRRVGTRDLHREGGWRWRASGPHAPFACGPGTGLCRVAWAGQSRRGWWGEVIPWSHSRDRDLIRLIPTSHQSDPDITFT